MLAGRRVRPDLYDLGYHQFESVELGTDLRLLMFRQRAAVASPQFCKPMSPQRLSAGETNSKQQALLWLTWHPLTNQNLGFHGQCADGAPP